LKILFPLSQAGSGSDIFTYNLVFGLNTPSIQAEIQYLPKWSGYIPSFMGKMCNSTGYDIIHANTWNGFAFTRLKPTVVTSHSAVRLPELKKYQTISQHSFYKLVSKREASSLKTAMVVCCVSRFTAKYLEKMYGYSDSTIIYNGINTDIFCPIQNKKTSNYNVKDKKIKLFFSGNTRLMKGFDLIPKIMRELGEEYILTIASGLRNQKRSTPQNNIIDLGRIKSNQIHQFYQDTDVFLFPSRLEGFGLSVAEAMACGKPVVTTDCSSLPELVIDGKGGYLCPMDDVSAFAEAIRHLAEDENLRARMGRFNRQRVLDHFTIEKMTQEYLKVYRKIT